MLETLLGTEGQWQAWASCRTGNARVNQRRLLLHIGINISSQVQPTTCSSHSHPSPQDFRFELQDTTNQQNFSELKDQLPLEQLLTGLTSTRLHELVEEPTLTFEKAVKISNDAERVQRPLQE